VPVALVGQCSIHIVQKLRVRRFLVFRARETNKSQPILGSENDWARMYVDFEKCDFSVALGDDHGARSWG